MKTLSFLLFFTMLLVSCDSIINPKPSGTLSEEKMTEILVDMHLTEATLRIINDTLAKINDTTYLRSRFAEVFRKHDVAPGRFTKSLTYYIKHIELLDKIYGGVIGRLTEIETSLQEKTPITKQDSLKAASTTYKKITSKADSVRIAGKEKGKVLRLVGVDKN